MHPLFSNLAVWQFVNSEILNQINRAEIILNQRAGQYLITSTQRPNTDQVEWGLRTECLRENKALDY